MGIVGLPKDAVKLDNPLPGTFTIDYNETKCDKIWCLNRLKFTLFTVGEFFTRGRHARNLLKLAPLFQV